MNYNLIQNNLIEDTAEYFKYLSTIHPYFCSFLQSNPDKDYRPYQLELAATYCYRSHNVCAGAPGIGKTLIVGLMICGLYNQILSQALQGRPGRIQITVPNLLSANTRWLVDLELIPFLQGKVQVIHNPKDMFTSTAPIWVYTHDFPKRNLGKLRQNGGIVKKLLLRKFKPNLLVIDEVHNLKPDSARTKLWIDIKRRAKRVLGLSGTLSDGRLDLIYQVAKFIYGPNFPYDNLKVFQTEFGVNQKVETNYIGGETEIIKLPPRYLGHLSLFKVADYSKLSRTFFHRIRLSDPKVAAVATLPEIQSKIVEILPYLAHQKFYFDTLCEHRDGLERLLNINVGQHARALSLISPLVKASLYPPEGVQNKKLETIIDMLKDGRKTAIFTTYINSARLITRELRSHYGDEKVIRLYASDEEATPRTMTSFQREECITQFLFDSQVLAGVFSINVCSNSIDLNSADRIIFYDFPWQALHVQQCLYRVARPGNKFKTVEVIYLVNKGQIDQHAFNLIDTKNKAAKLLLDFELSELNSTDTAMLDIRQLISSTLLE